MRFEDIYTGWNQGRLTQLEAAEILGMSERTFRRYVCRYEAEGELGLEDRRASACVERGAALDEVFALQAHYRQWHQGWNARHYHGWYRREGGERSYSWVKRHLQAAGLIERGHKKGAHRKKRDRKPLPGMMIHQDGSRFEWLRGQWHDLIVTMDDATSEHHAMLLTPEEGTASSFAGMDEVIRRYGLPSVFYSDRGSHYWHTPVAGGAVDKGRLTQFGRAMRQLGIEMIAAYSPQARGRSERAFGTHQGRLPQELARQGIDTLEAANRYLAEEYLPRFNAEFAVSALEEGSAFVAWAGGETLKEILCEHHERTVGADNCVRFEGLTLQIPVDRHRCHYVKTKVSVHRYPDGTLSIFHGPRRLAEYSAEGRLPTTQVLLRQAA
jgi:transposase